MFQQHRSAEMLRLARQLLGGPWKETLALWFRKALGGNDVKSGGSLAAPRTLRRARAHAWATALVTCLCPITVVCSDTEDSLLVSRELNTKQKRVQNATFHRVSATPASPAMRLGIDSKRK